MRRLALLLALVALLAPGLAHAQTSAADEFRLGLEAFEGERWGEALARFRSALEIDPRDAVRFNIALCLEQLGRHREAAEEFERAAESEEVPEEARQQAAAQAEANRARLALVRASGWDGALLSVDDEPRCRLPCETAEDPGAHRISAHLDDRAWSEEVDLSEGERVLLSVVEPPARVIEVPAAAPVSEPGGSPAIGWLGGLGLALSAGATGATIGLGVHAQSLHDDYVMRPTLDAAREGSAFRDATNVALGLAVTGAVLFVIDLFVGTGG